MTTLEKRTELLTGIQHMSEAELDKLYQVMEKDFPTILASSHKPLTERPIGSMKGMLVSMSDDFNEPLEDFADYMPDDQSFE